MSLNTLRYGDIPKLFEQTKNDVTALLSGKEELTLGFDRFEGEDCGHVVNFIETVTGLVALRKCLNREGEFEYAGLNANSKIAELMAGAEERGKEVGYLYSGVVGDNISHNVAALAEVTTIYPPLS